MPGIAAMADQAIGLVAAAQRPDGYLNTFVQVLAPGRSTATSVGPRAVLHRPPRPGGGRLAPGARRRPAPGRRRARGRIRRARARARTAARRSTAIPRSRWPSWSLPRDRRAALPRPRRASSSTAAVTVCSARAGSAGYWQDHLPVARRPRSSGHAVRQLYLDCGAVDVAVEHGRPALLDAVMRRWRDMVATRMYLTGALGSRHATRRSATRSSCRRTAPTPRRVRPSHR